MLVFSNSLPYYYWIYAFSLLFAAISPHKRHTGYNRKKKTIQSKKLPQQNTFVRAFCSLYCNSNIIILRFWAILSFPSVVATAFNNHKKNIYTHTYTCAASKDVSKRQPTHRTEWISYSKYISYNLILPFVRKSAATVNHQMPKLIQRDWSR